jgi:3-oxocholest-4-en-26-oyl-CoA dehydrogenase beta subunit
MDWSFTEEQEELAALVRSVLEREVNEERRRGIDGTDERFDRELWNTLRALGVFDGLGLVELCRVIAELGRAVAAVPVVPLITAKLLGRADGIVAAAITDEPLRADRDGDKWKIHGTASTVQAAPYADAFLVTASSNGDARVFVVERGPGVSVEPQLVTSTDREGLVTFEGASATPTGIDPSDVRRHVTVAVCAHQLGVCERALELTAEYAKQRVQFDRPIATFQAVGQRLADAYIDVHGIRLTLWQAAWRLSESLDCDEEIATAKFWAADAGHRVAHTAVHVHGGMGIDLDYHLHRYFTAAKRNEFSLGSATEQLVSIGSALAEEPA